MRYEILAATGMMLVATHGYAQDVAFEWEGEVEIGVDSVVDSDVADNEITDTYVSIELGGTLSVGERVSFFALLAAEPVTDPIEDRTFDDTGLFIKELGIALSLTDNTVVSFGKVTPVFGRTWDEGAGFYSDTLGGDYELTEQIGILADVEFTNGGVLSFGAFYADDTVLSQSTGTNRERNTIEAGGAGNTGELDNFALAYTQDFDDTSVQVGVRHRSAGQGDVSDENGVVASVVHTFNDSFSGFAEVARFDGFEGSADNATYVTLNGAYYVGPWAFSGTLARRDLDTSGVTDLASVAAEYEFNNGFVVGAGLAFVDDDGTNDVLLGANLVIPLGG